MKIAALAALLLIGCAEPELRVSLAPVPTPPPAHQYTRELKRWSRHGSILADFDEALTVDATLHSPEFREAYGERWIEMYKLNVDDAAKKRAQLLAEIADVWEFHVESATHYYQINDFTVGKSSVWRVTLIDDRGRAVQPVDIRLSLDKRDVDVAFYPYAGIFSKGWRFRFPRTLPNGSPLVTPDTRFIALRITGPQGATDLVWVLEPHRAAAASR
jgi:hypothetical protein